MQDGGGRNVAQDDPGGEDQPPRVQERWPLLGLPDGNPYQTGEKGSLRGSGGPMNDLDVPVDGAPTPLMPA